MKQMYTKQLSIKIKTSLYLILFVLFAASCKTDEENSDFSETELPVEVPAYTLHWEYIGDFSEDQKATLKTWIEEVYAATEKTLGAYPFDVYVNFEASASYGSSPVPFGVARRRNGINSVHFYVNPSASLEDLLADWTAPHELSHLAIPFLGPNSKWFSEGFATFLSRQTMMEMGYYTQQEFDTLYRSKIAETKRYYSSSTKTFVEVSDSLLSQRIYGSMYWGSTSFFQTLDERLRREKNMRFIQVMQAYQTCCRLEDRSLKDVIRSFDSIIGETWCRDLMAQYRDEPSYTVMTNY